MGEFVRHTNVNEAKLLQVLEVKSIVGEGTSESPVIEIKEYFSLDGQLLARQGIGKLELGHWKGDKS